MSSRHPGSETDSSVMQSLLWPLFGSLLDFSNITHPSDVQSQLKLSTWERSKLPTISVILLNSLPLTISPPIVLKFYAFPYWSNPPFLPERDYVTFGSLLSQFRLSSVCRLSVYRPSSVTLVHPTQEVKPFGDISSPLCMLATLWPPCKSLRRSSQGNPSVGSVKRKRGIRAISDLSKAISHKRYKIDV